MHYYVLMVPPDYYAMQRGNLHEADPSAYLQIEKGYPQYLGNFWLTNIPDRWMTNRIIASPVEYNTAEAEEILKKFKINPEELKKVSIIPSDNRADGIVCGP